MEPFEKQWLSDRLDRIDTDNTVILQKVDKITATVTRHGVYWDIVKWTVVSGAGVAASGRSSVQGQR